MIPRASDYWVCAVCARGGCGGGYSKPRPFRPLWVCDDPECLQLARNTYTMKQDEFDRIEELAADKGWQAMGLRCDEIGKTDFAAMSPEEMADVFRRGIVAYRNGLKSLQGEAPF